MKTGFFHRLGDEKKNRAASMTTSAEPMVAAIIRKPRAGPTAATHIVPGGAKGMRGAEVFKDIASSFTSLKSIP